MEFPAQLLALIVLVAFREALTVLRLARYSEVTIVDALERWFLRVDGDLEKLADRLRLFSWVEQSKLDLEAADVEQLIVHALPLLLHHDAYPLILLLQHLAELHVLFREDDEAVVVLCVQQVYHFETYLVFY